MKLDVSRTIDFSVGVFIVSSLYDEETAKSFQPKLPLQVVSQAFCKQTQRDILCLASERFLGSIKQLPSASQNPTLLTSSSRIWLRCCSVQVVAAIPTTTTTTGKTAPTTALLLLQLKSGATLLDKCCGSSLKRQPNTNHLYYHLCYRPAAKFLYSSYLCVNSEV